MISEMPDINIYVLAQHWGRRSTPNPRWSPRHCTYPTRPEVLAPFLKTIKRSSVLVKRSSVLVKRSSVLVCPIMIAISAQCLSGTHLVESAVIHNQSHDYAIVNLKTRRGIITTLSFWGRLGGCAGSPTYC